MTHSVNSPTPERVLRRYLITATTARAAIESAGPAVLVVAIVVLGSASDGAFIAASFTAAAAVGGPVIGALLDRTATPRRGFAIALLVTAVGLAAIGVALGRLPFWVVLGLAAVTGLGYPAVTGAWTAQLSSLVPPNLLSRAYAADAGTYSVAAIVGPPLATSLIALGTAAPIALPVVMLIVATAALQRVPLRKIAPIRQHSLLSDLRHGFATIAKRAALRRTTLISVIAFGGEAALFVTAPLLAKNLTGSLAFTGVILGARAVGGILMAAILIRHPIRNPDRVLIGGFLLVGIIIITMGLFTTLPVIIVGAGLTGTLHAAALAAMFHVRNRESDDRVRAQVFTTSASLRMSAFAAATAGFGTLLFLGPSVVLLLGGAVILIAVVIGIGAGPRVPQHRRTLRRPVPRA
jgi:predicted MFS family arabinose efflux permease